MGVRGQGIVFTEALFACVDATVGSIRTMQADHNGITIQKTVHEIPFLDSIYYSELTDYSTSGDYDTGEFTKYGGKIYESKEDNVTGVWNLSKWTEISLFTFITKSIKALFTGSVDLYGDGTVYVNPSKLSFVMFEHNPKNNYIARIAVKCGVDTFHKYYETLNDIGVDPYTEEVLSYNVTSIVHGDKQIVIAGDHATDFEAGKKIKITGCTNALNNGYYTVDSAVYDTSTTIVVDEAINSSVSTSAVVSTLEEYTTGDFVIYDGELNICTTLTATSGAWDESEWGVTTIEGYFGHVVIHDLFSTVNFVSINNDMYTFVNPDAVINAVKLTDSNGNIIVEARVGDTTLRGTFPSTASATATSIYNALIA